MSFNKDWLTASNKTETDKRLEKVKNLKNTGRVNIDENSTAETYKLFEENTNNGYNNAIGNIQSKNILSDTFFSKQNMQILQNMIRKNVWLKTNKKHIISEQSEENLIIIMRSIYFQHSKNNMCNIAEQIKTLDKLVVDWCVPHIITEIDQYVGFRKEISNNVEPLEYGKYMSNAGTKSLNLDKLM